MKFDGQVLESFEERDAFTAEQLTVTAKLSYEQEVGRYESLIELGNRLLTSIAIVFATMAVLLQVLVGHVDALAATSQPVSYSGQQHALFCIYFLLVVGTLVASFITALLSSRRFEYEALNPPSKLAEWIEDNELFANRTIAALHFSKSLGEPYEKYYRRNERIRKLLTASMILLITSIGIATAGGLILMVPV